MAELVTFDQLNEFFEDTSEDIIAKYVEYLNDVLSFYEINNPQRISMFLAQVGHESGGMRTIKENLNYSADGLKKIFPKYFRTVNPADYAKKPEKIANRVYASRMGNGDEASGDGFRYCGRGLIQLTGKSNYMAFAQDMNMSLEEATEWLKDEEGATWSAGWFWDSRELNQWADKGDILTVTKKINGGTIGLEDRKHHYEAALEIFGG
jgi:putative chitinase